MCSDFYLSFQIKRFLPRLPAEAIQTGISPDLSGAVRLKFVTQIYPAQSIIK